MDWLAEVGDAFESIVALAVLQALLRELLADVGDTLESSFALVVVQALKTEWVTVLLHQSPPSCSTFHPTSSQSEAWEREN